MPTTSQARPLNGNSPSRPGFSQRGHGNAGEILVRQEAHGQAALG